MTKLSTKDLDFQADIILGNHVIEAMAYQAPPELKALVDGTDTGKGPLADDDAWLTADRDGGGFTRSSIERGVQYRNGDNTSFMKISITQFKTDYGLRFQMFMDVDGGHVKIMREKRDLSPATLRQEFHKLRVDIEDGFLTAFNILKYI